MKLITIILQKVRKFSIFRHKRYLIILLAALCALTGFAHATDNRTFNRLYYLSSEDFLELLDYYVQHDLTDSLMLCANIQASKYGKEKLTKDEIFACCTAYRYLGLEYLRLYYNYQMAAENYLKAEQIAEQYRFVPLQNQIAIEKTVLAATQNDLQNNFAYNKNVMDSFKKDFHLTLEQTKSDNSDFNRVVMETTAANLLLLALKFDKTDEVTREIKAYREAKKQYGACCNIVEVLCDVIESCIAGNYDNAFEALQKPLTRSTIVYDDMSFIQMQSIVNNVRYFVSLRSGKRSEALKVLLELEQSLRENGMTFELLDALQLIRHHYEMEGNKALADKYALLYYTTKDEFLNKSRVGRIDEAKLNLELEQTRERISEMSYRQKMQSILLWSAIIITLLALGILAVLYVNYRKTKRTNRLLYEKNIALLNANTELRPTAVEISDKPTQEGPSQADLELLDKITVVMESSPEVFEETFSRQRLAELVGSNYKAVSRAINTCKGCNFNVLLNEYRIKEACRRLMDTSTYGSYTIEAIANSIGYKSRSNFATVFKEIVGLTPSAFQKMRQEDKSSHPTNSPDNATLE